MARRMRDGPWCNYTPGVRDKCMNIWGGKYCTEMARPERLASREHSLLGIELDPIKQGHSKLGEVVLALTFGRPLSVLNWEIGNGDFGIDMTLDRDTFDAKTTTSSSARFLFQSVKDVDRLAEAIVADKLVLVQLEPDKLRGRCRGYLQRERFLDLHHIATDIYPRNNRGPMLIPGTPFVEVDWLDDIWELIEAHKFEYFNERRPA